MMLRLFATLLRLKFTSVKALGCAGGVLDSFDVDYIHQPCAQSIHITSIRTECEPSLRSFRR